MKTIFCSICCLILFIGSFSNSKAQVIDSTYSHHIKEVQVTAQLSPSITLSTNSLQTINSQTIDNAGILSIADAVRRFSGVVVKDFGGIGGMKTISVRGVGSEHTSVLYDGIAVSNAMSGQIDISQFSLDNVEMLSMTIGQPDNIFRTARASSAVGVLNIETKRPSFKQNNYNAIVQLRSGSWGLFNPYVYYAYKLSNKFSVSYDGSWQRADGQYKFKKDNGNTTMSQKRQNTDVNIWRSELNLFGHLDSKQDLSMKIYFFDSEQGLPGPYVLYADKNDERLWSKNFFAQAKYLNRINQKLNIQVQGKYSNTSTKYIDKNPKYEGGILDNRYKQNELYLTSTLLYNYTENLSFSLAEDVSYATLDANIEYFAYPKRYSSLTAFCVKYTQRRFSIIGNMLGTYITENVKKGTASDDRQRISPSISMSYKIMNNENVRLRASFKDIFRAPTFNDLYYTTVGNKSLKPEKTQQYNLGITWSKSFSSFFEFFTFTSDIYHNNVKDKIIIYPSSFYPKTINLGKVEINGIDISMNSRFAFSDKIHLDISGNYSYQDAIDKTNSTDKNYKDQIPYTPKHSGGGMLSIENPYVNISYSIIASGKTYADAQNIERNLIDGYTDQTISLNKSFLINGIMLRTQADVSNISNKTYYIMSNYPMPGRAYRFTIRCNF